MILTKLKLWLAAAAVTVMAVLTAMLKWSQHKREQAEQARDKAEREIIEQTEIANTQSELNRVQTEARQNAKENKPTTSRPTGNFGDDRLRGKDRD